MLPGNAFTTELHTSFVSKATHNFRYIENILSLANNKLHTVIYTLDYPFLTKREIFGYWVVLGKS